MWKEPVTTLRIYVQRMSGRTVGRVVKTDV